MADEYIRRDDALKYIKSEQCRTCSDIGLCGNCAVLVAVRLLKEVPAADVAPVVRCKDCQHFKHYGKTSLFADGKNIKAGWCNRRVRYDEEYRMPPDGFCSYGRRMDGGNENG